ncbi:MAG: L-threonylcarbamoyladenylate synthase [Candidatus Pacebacteria bacterium]|nr:L-threonylcarbamoyladenylate synthase [Candidatus Paceibacterota bacterium]
MDTIVKSIKNDGVGVMPTDTLYGLVGSALSPKAVERIYELRQRDKDKPCIVLISSVNDLGRFGVTLPPKLELHLSEFWPGKVSIIFDTPDERFAYLHRGGKTLAFRFPYDKDLIEILNQTGPLIAPSANVQGLPPAKTVEEAEKYFSTKVDFYQDGGELNGEPSAVIRFDGDTMVVIRDGSALKAVKASI